ncbi:MAG: glycosyltransferase family 4 protein [Flavipsychrobacter sp.]
MSKKFLIISSEFPPGPGGIGRHAYSLAKSLVYHNVSVHVVSHFDHASEEEVSHFIKNIDEGITLHPISRKGAKTYFDRIRKVLNLTKKIGFDKVIITGSFPIWLGYMLKKKFGNNIVVEGFVHGTEINPEEKTKRLLTHTSLAALDKIWAVSTFTKSLLPQKVLDNNDVDVMPNGLDLLDWNYDEEKLKPFDDWKGYPKILTVGSITPRKGQHQVIKALPKLIEKYPDIQYHMVGVPANKDAIIELAEKLNVLDHITIHGRMQHHEDLIRSYLSADVFIMLSEKQDNGDVEGFGIAILEANIMGLAAIGSNDSGIVDAIDDGKNGFLVDGANANEILTAIDKVLNYDKAILTANCKAWALKHDWNKLSEELL